MWNFVQYTLILFCKMRKMGQLARAGDGTGDEKSRKKSCTTMRLSSTNGRQITVCFQKHMPPDCWLSCVLGMLAYVCACYILRLAEPRHETTDVKMVGFRCPRVAFYSSETGVNLQITSRKRQLSEWARFRNAIGGIYFAKKRRAETPQPGLEFDNFKPRLT
jgi:hypothetical protein